MRNVKANSPGGIQHVCSERLTEAWAVAQHHEWQEPPSVEDSPLAENCAETCVSSSESGHRKPPGRGIILFHG